MISAKQKETLYPWFSSDYHFHQLYPENIRSMAERHWTPLAVAKRAAKFLAATKGSRILDLGSGAGKFCIAAAYHQPHACFIGIEQNAGLAAMAQAVTERLGLDNVNFIIDNITQLNLAAYDHFYFYNSFFELVSDPTSGSVDDSRVILYKKYMQYITGQFARLPPGTRIACFHCFETGMPGGYEIAGVHEQKQLYFWIKK